VCGILVVIASLSRTLDNARPLNSDRPRFDPDYRWIPGTPIERVRYGSSDPPIIVNNRMWINGTMGSPPEWHVVLFDLKTREVVGRLHDGDPIAPPINGNILCYTQETQLPGSLAKIWGVVTGQHPRFSRFGFPNAKKPFSLNIPIPWTPFDMSPSEREEFWMIGCQSSSVPKFLATLRQCEEKYDLGALTPGRSRYFRRHRYPGEISIFGPGVPESYTVFDFPAGNTHRIRTTNNVSKIWQTDEVAFDWEDDGSITTLDIVTGQKTHFISNQVIAEFVMTNGLTRQPRECLWQSIDTPAGVRLCLGPQAEFRDETDNEQKTANRDRWLASVDHNTGKLKLLSKSFQPPFWSCQANNHLTHSVSAGESNSVHLIRIATGDETKIVAAQKKKDILSEPFFYEDQIIYNRSDGIWITDIDGKKHDRLFPPPESNVD
jgi:hypothetical protein